MALLNHIHTSKIQEQRNNSERAWVAMGAKLGMQDGQWLEVWLAVSSMPWAAQGCSPGMQQGATHGHGWTAAVLKHWRHQHAAPSPPAPLYPRGLLFGTVQLAGLPMPMRVCALEST